MEKQKKKRALTKEEAHNDELQWDEVMRGEGGASKQTSRRTNCLGGKLCLRDSLLSFFTFTLALFSSFLFFYIYTIAFAPRIRYVPLIFLHGILHKYFYIVVLAFNHALLSQENFVGIFGLKVQYIHFFFRNLQCYFQCWLKCQCYFLYRHKLFQIRSHIYTNITHR